LFYLGMLSLRDGRAQEAVRYLAEANRLDPSCPMITWQLGLAIVAAGGDSALALRALQRSLPRFVPLKGTETAMQRLWTEAMPENRSFVRRLALEYPYDCPVLGSDLSLWVRQGQFALAQAQYRLGQFQASADLFAMLLQECPPSATLLRGLGLALARLE